MKTNFNLPSFKRAVIYYVLFLAIFIQSCDQNKGSTNQPSNGELNETFVQQPQSSAYQQTPSTTETSQPILTEQEKLKRAGWKEMSFSNGVMPDCYNYTPGYGSLENSLDVTVGRGTDVVIKVMSLSTHQCVRYVFINSGTTYSISNLPEDKYYLKIAYGHNWMSFTENNSCNGKFVNNSLYEKGTDVLDFNRQITIDGYSIPNYRLQLDVVSNYASNSFTSSGISEAEFNN